MISYGDSIKKEDPTDDSGSTNKHVLVGNALGLFASIAYAFYEGELTITRSNKVSKVYLLASPSSSVVQNKCLPS